MSKADFTAQQAAIAPEISKPDKPKIEIGQKWRARDGSVVSIIKLDSKDTSYPWLGDNENWYTERGTDWWDSRETQLDLVELIQDASGFTIWRGGEQPEEARGASVMVKLRGVSGSPCFGGANDLHWCHLGGSGDIVAYKVVKVDAPPATTNKDQQWLNVSIGQVMEFKNDGAHHACLDVDEKATADSAIGILEAAAGHMRDRAATYDRPKGERSMAQTVAAFNAIAGRDLEESEGWLLMDLLKLTRLFAHPGFHRDSAEDHVAYGALLAEARAKEAAESLPED